VFDVPLAVDDLDAHLRVLPDPLGALVWPEAGVVVDGVLGEVRGDEVGVARVQRVVIAADVVEVRADVVILTARVDFGLFCSSLG
jgi:hypothetical protein